MLKFLILFSIILICAQLSVATVCVKMTSAGQTKSCALNENGLKTYMVQLIRALKQCKNSIKDKESALSNTKNNDEQLAVCQVQLNAKDNSIKDLTEQLEAHRSQINTIQNKSEALQNQFETSCLNFGNGIHTLKVPGIEPFNAFCDASSAGRGWIVILRRQDGSGNFNRNWSDYKEGFGDLSGEFWLGLEKLHRLTASQPHELYIRVDTFANFYASYDSFEIGSEEEQYEMKKLGKHSGTYWDLGMRSYENMKFRTRDRDSLLRCATIYTGGWWFPMGSCGIRFYTTHYKTLKMRYVTPFVQMMIRPKSLII